MIQPTLLDIGLGFAGILFIIGLVGVIARRSMIFMLIGTEIMLNAAGFAFIVGGSRWADAGGQVMFIFLVITAATEVAVGLAIVLLLSTKIQDLDADKLAGEERSWK